MLFRLGDCVPRLVFLVDQTQQLCCPLFQAAWKKLKTKRHLWDKVRTHFCAFVYESMTELLTALARGITPQEALKGFMNTFRPHIELKRAGRPEEVGRCPVEQPAHSKASGKAIGKTNGIMSLFIFVKDTLHFHAVCS